MNDDNPDFQNQNPESAGPDTKYSRTAGSEDKVVLCLYVTWGQNYPFLMQQLEAAKKCAGEGEDGGDTFTVDNIEFVVAATGYKLVADGKPGPYIPYKATANGIRYGFRREQQALSNTPNVHLQIDSLALIESGGFDSVWDDIKEAIQKLGGFITKSIITRVDPCADIVGMSVAPFMQAFHDDRYLCRASYSQRFRLEDMPTCAEKIPDNYQLEPDPEGGMIESAFRWRKRDTGLVIGRSSVLCRIYDKILSIKNHDPLKEQAMLCCRYGTEKLPETATRVEFQLRRAFFKSLAVDGMEVNSVEDWQKHRASIMKYLCTKWLRFCAAPFNRKHPEKAVVIPEWETALAHFLEWCNAEVRPIVRKPKTVKARIENLIVQARGCLQTASLLAGKAIECIGDFKDFAFRQIDRVSDKDDFWEKMDRKKLLMECRLPWHVRLAEICGGDVIRSTQPKTTALV